PQQGRGIFACGGEGFSVGRQHDGRDKILVSPRAADFLAGGGVAKGEVAVFLSQDPDLNGGGESPPGGLRKALATDACRGVKGDPNLQPFLARSDLPETNHADLARFLVIERTLVAWISVSAHRGQGFAVRRKDDARDAFRRAWGRGEFRL